MQTLFKAKKGQCKREKQREKGCSAAFLLARLSILPLFARVITKGKMQESALLLRASKGLCPLLFDRRGLSLQGSHENERGAYLQWQGRQKRPFFPLRFARRDRGMRRGGLQGQFGSRVPKKAGESVVGAFVHDREERVPFALLAKVTRLPEG